MRKSSRSGMLVEHQCPQCGAPVTLEETDRLFCCDHCRVRLFLTFTDHFRFSLPYEGFRADEVSYIPYWRIRGMYFTVQPNELRNRVVDNSFKAVPLKFAPPSLGVRAQALKLRYAEPEGEARFLAPLISLEDLASRLQLSFSPQGGKAYLRTLVHDTVSVIYAPVYDSGSAAYDCVLKRPLGRLRDSEREDFLKMPTAGSWRLGFLPALCPGCGWDLSGGKKSTVLHCTNCSTAWKEGQGGFRRQTFTVLDTAGEKVICLPFWRLRANISGLPLDSYADFIRTTNIPRAIREGWEKRPLYFWSPASSFAPRTYMRLSKQITLVQPTDSSEAELPRNVPVGPVNISAADAFEGIKTVLASVTASKRLVFPFLEKLVVETQESQLVYIPFSAKGRDYYQEEMKISVQRNAFRE